MPLNFMDSLSNALEALKRGAQSPIETPQDVDSDQGAAADAARTAATPAQAPRNPNNPFGILSAINKDQALATPTPTDGMGDVHKAEYDDAQADMARNMAPPSDTPEAAPPQRTLSTQKSAPAPVTAQPAKAGSGYDDVKAMIMKKYGLGDDSDKLKEAQKAAHRNNATANLAEAFGGIAQAANKHPLDTSFYEHMRERADKPVAELLQQRGMKEENLKNANAVDDLTKKELNQNPNSSVAKALMATYGPIMKKIGMDPASINGLSADGIKEFVQNPMDAMIKMKTMEEAAKERAMMQKLMLQNKAGQVDNKADTDAYKQLSYFKPYQQAATQVYQADHLIGMAQEATKNPAAANALSTEAANYISGGQRLHTATIESMKGGSQAIMSRLHQISQTSAGGTLTPENAAFMADFIKHEKAAAQTEMNQIKNDRGEAYKATYGHAPRSFGAPTPAQGAPASEPQGGKVKVSNGKQSFMIDAADVAHAAQDNFHPVGGQ